MNDAMNDLSLRDLAALVAQDLSATHGIAYARLSPDLQVVQVSANFADLLVDPPAQILGKQLTELFWEFVGVEDALDEVLAGTISSFQLDRVNRIWGDDRVHYLDFRISPVDDLHPDLGLLLLIEDVTQAGELEQRLIQDKNDIRMVQTELAKANLELRRINRLKSLFLSMAAHDMRGPLTAILGYADLLRADLSPEGQESERDFLSIILSQANWLNRVLADLLDLDQIEQGKLKIVPETCDLNSLITDVAALLEDLAVRQDLSLSIVLPSTPILILADPERTRRILFNLMNNAIKYTSGGGHIQVQAWMEEDYGAFHVKDTGKGMSPEELGRVYQLYYRTSDARLSKVSGTGLGLFIVKTLVEAHHGEISVESNPGVGTTFTVRLPGVN